MKVVDIEVTSETAEELAVASARAVNRRIIGAGKADGTPASKLKMLSSGVRDFRSAVGGQLVGSAPKLMRVPAPSVEQIIYSVCTVLSLEHTNRRSQEILTWEDGRKLTVDLRRRWATSFRRC